MPAFSPGARSGPLAQGDETNSIDQLMAELSDERERLRRDISAVEGRIAAAGRRSLPLEADAQGELGALVLAVYDELAEIEREHADALFGIQDAAVAEVMRVLEGAHQRVSLIWARTSEVGTTAPPFPQSLLPGVDPTDVAPPAPERR